MTAMQLPADAQTVIDAARVFGGKAFVVGGAIRDHVMGVKPKDFDIEVHGLSSLEGLSALLKTFGRVDEVGVSFGVLKFGRDIDVSLPRRDSKTGDGHRGFTIEVDSAMSIAEALSRRDFTMNSMAYDPDTHEIIDPFGGQRDIEEKVLSHTSDAFAEDPLRVMRAVQFACRFGFTLRHDTARLCQSLIPEMKHLAKERLWGEWEKILTKGRSFVHFQMALRATGMDQILPFKPFLGASGTDQTRVAEAFDLDRHTERPAAILASWAMSCRGGEPSHDEVHDLFEHLGVPHDLRVTARKMRHGAIFVEVIDTWTQTDARRIARMIAPVPIAAVVRFARDDERRTGATRAAYSAGVLLAPLPPLVTGDDLIALGMTPGPEFGPILRAALEAQDRGDFTTKAEGIGFINVVDVEGNTL